MSKFYRVTLTAMGYVSTTVMVEVEDEDVDDDGFPLDETNIADMAYERAWSGCVDWQYDGVDSDTIQVGTITGRWGE